MHEFRLILSEATLQILESCREPKQFNDLRTILNPRTGKNFSQNTLSTRLKNLIKIGALKNIMLEKGGRRVVAYKITRKGHKILELCRSFEEDIKRVIGT